MLQITKTFDKVIAEDSIFCFSFAGDSAFKTVYIHSVVPLKQNPNYILLLGMVMPEIIIEKKKIAETLAILKEQGRPVVPEKLIFPRKSDFVFTGEIPPRAFCTNKEKLEQWVKDNSQ